MNNTIRKSLIATLMLSLFLHGASAASSSKSSAETTYLSPTALAATSDGTTLYIAGATANRILIFDTASETVKGSIAVPDSPLGIVLSPDNSQLFVTCAAPESTVAVIDLAKGKVTKKIRGGHTTMAPVVSRDGKTLFVCHRFNNAVAAIDLAKGKELYRVPVPREPVAAALTLDGKFLLVANHIHAGRSDVDVVASSISVIDTAQGRVIKDIPLPNGSTIVRDVQVSPDGKFAAVTHILARFHLPTTQIERGWMNNNALSIIDLASLSRFNTVLLDNIDSGAGNPWAAAWSTDGTKLCVTHAGTHEVSVIEAHGLLQKLAKMPASLNPGQPNDYTSASRIASDVPNDLAFLVGLRQRIKLGEKGPRPMLLIGNKAYIGNYFSDSLSILDVTASRPAPKCIPLGSKQPLTVLRQGELNFNDASICFQGWQSCGSCHSSDARVDGMNWDLLNDGIGNPKNVKSMLLAHQTPPSMSMGVRTNAETAVRAGIKNSLFVVLPEEIPAAIDEYLKALTPIPSPYLTNGKLSKEAKRGKKLFMEEKVGCFECHKPDKLYTNQKLHDVGSVGRFDKPTDRFDTPSLIEVWRSGPYLHDGSAATIRDVLTVRNRNNEHGQTSHLTAQQIDDLVAFVLSL